MTSPLILNQTNDAPPSQSFDYAPLDLRDSTALQAAADRIRQRNRAMGETIIQTGIDLIAAKDRLPHGRFGAWLKAEFSWSERAARNYMAAAEAFGTKTATVAVLPPATIYKLAAPSTPSEIRDRVVADLEAGKSVDWAEVNDEIKEARPVRDPLLERRLKRARRRGNLTPEKKAQIQRQVERDRDAAKISMQELQKQEFIHTRASMARAFASYNGPIDDEIIGAALQTAAIWQAFTDQLLARKGAAT